MLKRVKEKDRTRNDALMHNIAVVLIVISVFYFTCHLLYSVVTGIDKYDVVIVPDPRETETVDCLIP